MSCWMSYCIASATSRSFGIAWETSYDISFDGEEKIFLLWKIEFGEYWHNDILRVIQQAMDVNTCLTQRCLKRCGGSSIVKLPLNQRALRKYSRYVVKHDEETNLHARPRLIGCTMPCHTCVSVAQVCPSYRCAAQGWPQAKKLFFRRCN